MKPARSRDLYKLTSREAAYKLRRFKDYNAIVEAEDAGELQPAPRPPGLLRLMAPATGAVETLHLVEHHERRGWLNDERERSAAGRLLWNRVRDCVGQGEAPPANVVAKALELAPSVPLDLAPFVASVIRNEVRYRSGPVAEPAFPISRVGFDRAAWVYRVRRYWNVYKSERYQRERERAHRRVYGARTMPPKPDDAREKAFKAVAGEAGVSVRQLESWYYWKP